MGKMECQGWAPGTILGFVFFMSRGWCSLFKRLFVDILDYLCRRGLGNGSSARRGQEMDFSRRCFLKITLPLFEIIQDRGVVMETIVGN